MTQKIESHKITFPGSLGNTLEARLDIPPNPKFWGVYAPCFTCTKDIRAAKRITRALAEKNIAMMALDFSGLGGSTGRFAQANFSSNVEDLLLAVDYLKSHYDHPSILVGHSLGGTTCLVAASRNPNIQAVVTLNSPCHPKHVARHFPGLEDELAWKGEADICIEGRPFRIQRHFLEDLSRYDMKDVLKNMQAAALFCHAPGDPVVSIKNASYLFSLASHPKSFMALEGADHLLTDHRDTDYLAELIDAWSQRYIDVKSPEKNTDATVHIHQVSPDALTQKITVGAHTLMADEPTTFAGGKDLGPTPYDYLLVSIGSCTSMTLRLYANHKKWPLTDVEVHLHHSRQHQEDCDACAKDSTGPYADVIVRTLVLKGPLSKEQRQRLVEIADKCPVHKTLTNIVKIQTLMQDA